MTVGCFRGAGENTRQPALLNLASSRDGRPPSTIFSFRCQQLAGRGNYRCVMVSEGDPIEEGDRND